MAKHITVEEYKAFVAKGQFGQVCCSLAVPFALAETRHVLDDDGNETGTIHDTARATIGKILRDVGAAIKAGDAQGPFENVDYVSIGNDFAYARNGKWARAVKNAEDLPFPDYHWLACYYVTGGSEGHYVHVDVIDKGARRMLFLIKTFGGRVEAQRIANLLALRFEV